MSCATPGCHAARSPGSWHCEGHRPVIDLTEHLDIDAFDLVMRAVEETVNRAQSLSLDSTDDRLELMSRLRQALGAVG